MKIRTDFVTNSSSSCFVVALSKEVDEALRDFKGFGTDNVLEPFVAVAMKTLFN
jgi:hypothetical protein